MLERRINMFVIYFTIPTTAHQLTMQEIRETDKLETCMLEHVATMPDGELYSWHDIPTKTKVCRILEYIRENIGEYTTDVVEELDIGDGRIKSVGVSIADFTPIQKDDLHTITLDADTHIVEIVHAPAWMIPDYFDQCHVAEIMSEQTGEIIYQEGKIGECDYIAENLVEFLNEIE